MTAPRAAAVLGAMIIVVLVAWRWRGGRADHEPDAAPPRTAPARDVNLPAAPARARIAGLPQAIARPWRRYRVSGTVTIGSTATPCPGAEVSLVDGDHHELHATLDADGTEHVEGLSPGRYTVDVSCKNHRSARYAPIVVADRDVDGLAWPVSDGASIGGRIVSSLGLALPGSVVSIALDGVDTPATTSGWGSDQSDAAGRFRIAGLAPGIYVVGIESTGGMHPAGGFRVAVADGETVTRDFVLDAVGLVDGIVADPDGAPIANTEVFTRALSTRWSNIVTTDEAGRFVVTARLGGDLALLVQRPGRAFFLSDDHDTDTRLVVRPGVNRVTVTVPARHATLRGRVTDRNALPRPGVTVSAIAERPSDVREEARVAANAVTTGDDGQFEIAGLDSGAYTVRAFEAGAGEAFVSHVAAGSVVEVQLP